MPDEYVYQTKVYEPKAPWAGTDGWSGWSNCDKGYYDEVLLRKVEGMKTRRLKVDQINGQPV